MRDAVATMGTILDDSIQGRDAVHVAVIAVTAARTMAPGAHVDKDGDQAGLPIGIVDPFLPRPVRRGERFWLYLYPRTITGLSHTWTHPAFPDEEAISPKPVKDELVRFAPDPDDVEASKQWLDGFIEKSDCPSYEVLISAAVGDHHKNDGLDGGYTMSELYESGDEKYLHFGGRDAHGEIPAEFWDHVENVTGRRIPPEKRAGYFSCSC